MSEPIETATEEVFISALAAVAAASNLQLVRQIDDGQLGPQRLVVACRDLGEDKAVAYGGTYARHLQLEVHLHTNKGDVTADQTEQTGAAVFLALKTPAPDPSATAPFAVLVIFEVAQSELTFDRLNWVKVYTVLLTGKLL